MNPYKDLQYLVHQLSVLHQMGNTFCPESARFEQESYNVIRLHLGDTAAMRFRRKDMEDPDGGFVSSYLDQKYWEIEFIRDGRIAYRLSDFELQTGKWLYIQHRTRTLWGLIHPHHMAVGPVLFAKEEEATDFRLPLWFGAVNKLCVQCEDRLVADPVFYVKKRATLEYG